MPRATVAPLNPMAWLVAPAAMCMAGALLLALPLKIYGLRLPEPVFAMAPAFAWGLIRRSMLPAAGLVVLGLFQDVLWGGALGLWPLCLLTAYGLAFWARRVASGQDFLTQAAWYAGICAIAFGLGEVLTALAAGAWPNLLGLGLQYLATVALFPLAWLIIERFEDADVRFR